MYAVFKAGSRQYRVEKGNTLRLDYIAGKVGEKVEFSDVLMLGGSKPEFGTPTIKGAKVSAVIKEQAFNDKVIVFKYRRRKNSKKKNGHKQPMTVVEIKDIKS